MTTRPPLPLPDGLRLYEREFLAGRNLAPLTRQAYLADLDELTAFLADQAGVQDATQVRREHLDGFLSDLDRRCLSGNYRRRKIAAIRSFFGFLEERGLLTLSPARKLIPPEREHRQPRYLSEREYKALLDACRHETRDAAIIELLLQTGMRLSELARLSLSDIDLPARISKEPDGAGSVRIVGKGRRERTVTLNWKACKAIRAYLAVRPKEPDEQHLFLTKFRAGISPRSIERLVEKYLDEAAIRGASVHSLRHTFGTHSVKRGTRLKVVQDVLGHASLDTTTIYVSLAREDMDRQLQEHAL
jgi:site-specific recombinase XerD